MPDADSRIRVSRALYIRALADAIDWQDSYLASHDPYLGVAAGHCGPSAGTGRCEEYRKAAALLKRYRRAYAKATGRWPEPEPGRSVPLSEIKENWPFGEAAPRDVYLIAREALDAEADMSWWPEGGSDGT